MNAEERAFLAAADRGFLATADEEARPAVVPVCFALVGAGEDAWIASPLDEKPKAGGPRELRRVRDVRDNPRVALVVDRYDDDWTDLAWVQVRGTASVLAPGEAGHADAVGALRSAYAQYADHALAERPLLRVDPGHTVSWAADGGLGQSVD